MEGGHLWWQAEPDSTILAPAGVPTGPDRACNHGRGLFWQTSLPVLLLSVSQPHGSLWGLLTGRLEIKT
jgi:hypothetical protein